MSNIVDRYIREFMENPEMQAKFFVYSQYVVTGMVVLGLLIMFYILFYR
ncbi:MAG TPA: hypothetical protein VK436_13150 [Methanocella sp.]|nr:hypothetical protein [Methanocella sp.]